MRNARIRCAFDVNLGPLNIRNISIGQGGLSPEPMWENRIPEIRSLNPNLVRFWIQEYFAKDSEQVEYDFEAIDRSITMILATGGTPLISLNMKPKRFYPVVDEKILEPSDWAAWDEFIHRFVKHFVDNGYEGWYWEVIGETDCGEGGGCPFLGTPDTYLPFYSRTSQAILDTDPSARIGGPALANCRSPILPALLDYCVENDVPLHFVSWHIYSTDPGQIRETIEYVNSELEKRSSLKVETILDEWSILWETSECLEPKFLPCFIPETAWHMIDANLDHSCYYHIRDYPVDQKRFEPFFTKEGAAFMARWWNRMPQWGGLFDQQNIVRPAYFSFKMLKRLEGDRMLLESDDDRVHGFFTHDKNFNMYILMFWNFSSEPVDITLEMTGIPRGITGMPFVLDISGDSNDENNRIRPLGSHPLSQGSNNISINCEPYGIHMWYFKGEGWSLIQ